MSDQRDSGIAWTDQITMRFWSYVDRRGHDECWPWTAGRFSTGMRYGQFRVGPRKMKTHRVAFTLVNGDPRTLRVLHHCDNPVCCNPAHLYAGTDADNARDRERRGRSNRGPLPRLPGEHNPAAKLDAERVEEIRRRLTSGVLQRNLAEEFGVSQSQISNIARGASWRT